MGEARQRAVSSIPNPQAEMGNEHNLVDTPTQTITHMRVLQSVRFNRTENVSLSSSREKCSFRTAPEGVYVTGECPTILIPWSNIAWVELK